MVASKCTIGQGGCPEARRGSRRRTAAMALMLCVAAPGVTAASAAATGAGSALIAPNEPERQRRVAAGIDSVEAARVFLEPHPTGPAPRAIRGRASWLRVGRRVIEDGEVIRSIRLSQDAAGNLVRRTWQDGDWIEIDHVRRGRAMRERMYAGDRTLIGRVVYDYDARGRRIRERYFTSGRDRPDLEVRYDHGRAGQRAREVTLRRDGSRTIALMAHCTTGRLHFTRSRALSAGGVVVGTARVTFVYGSDGHRTRRFERAQGETGPYEARTRCVRDDDDGRLLRDIDQRTLDGRWLKQARTVLD